MGNRMDLRDWGIDSNRVSVELYENVRPQRKRIEAKVLETLRLIGDGQGAICYMTQDMLAKTGALAEETEDVVEQMRSISGVEYAAFLKEQEDGSVRVSLRAKRRGNVAAIAEQFGGGGHINIAGAQVRRPMDEVEDMIKEIIDEMYQEEETKK